MEGITMRTRKRTQSIQNSTSEKTPRSLNSDRAIFHAYFSDFYQFQICTAVLCSIAFILGMQNKAFWTRLLTGPLLFILLQLLRIRYVLLFFTALRDLCVHRTEEVSVCVKEVVRDRPFILYSRGVQVGHEKNILIDSTGNRYRISAPDSRFNVPPDPAYYAGAKIKLRCLVASRIVLHMTVIPSDEASVRLRRDFLFYCMKCMK